MHIPVLMEQILAQFSERPLTAFIDGTLGLGGHAEALLKSHPEIEYFLGIDQDEEALKRARERLLPFGEKVHFVHGSFRHLNQYTQRKVGGILLDVGVSSMQLDQAERGFSFSKEGPLDMRMDQNQRLTAEEVVNRYPEEEIARIFHEYGEVRGSRRLAKGLAFARKKKRIKSTKELCDVLMPLMGAHPKHIHPMTLIFQALRICVNDELAALQEGLGSAFAALGQGGRLCVISFHSLEDRIVKNFFRDLARIEKAGILLTKKPEIATAEEVRANPRSRSAKLRVIEKI